MNSRFGGIICEAIIAPELRIKIGDSALRGIRTYAVGPEFRRKQLVLCQSSPSCDFYNLFMYAILQLPKSGGDVER